MGGSKRREREWRESREMRRREREREEGGSRKERERESRENGENEGKERYMVLEKERKKLKKKPYSIPQCLMLDWLLSVSPNQVGCILLVSADCMQPC